MGRPYSSPDWSPYKKRTFGHRDAQRKDHVRTRQVDSHLQARDKDQKKSHMQTPSDLQNGDKINFYC